MQRSIALPSVNLARLKWNQDVVDVILGLILAGFAFWEGWEHRAGESLIGFLLLGTQTLPVMVRRRNPMRVLIVTGISTCLYFGLQFPAVNSWTGVFVAFYTVAANESRIKAAIAAATTTIGIAVSFVAYINAAPDHDASAFWTTYVMFAVAWLFGDNLRVRRAYKKQLDERAWEIERDREQQSGRAVQEERARIARELHDVVAHYVSVMVVQSAGARRIAEKDPAAARGALEAVEAAGRTAIAEMRRMLEVLRADDSGMGPQPGLGDLDKLIGHVQDAGLPVDLSVEGETCCLPAGMDLAAYRIVQEALTNTVKHGGKARASVAVRYLSETLEIEVTDDGRGAAAPLVSGMSGGQGLIGMQERVSLFGGTLQAGPRLTGGYRVFARMPIEPDDSARARTAREQSMAAGRETDTGQAQGTAQPETEVPGTSTPAGEAEVGAASGSSTGGPRLELPTIPRRRPRKAAPPAEPPESQPRRSLPPLIVRVVPPRPPHGPHRGRHERGEQ